jgi:ABC-type phosphate transport system substrate-binding protein
LYIYVNKAKAAANPAVVAWVDFYLTNGTISKVLETVPYVNLPQPELDASRSTWESSK